MRLIDANAFKGKLIRELNKTGKYTPYECGLDDAISYLDNAPTVDAVPAEKYNELKNRYKKLLETAEILDTALRQYQRLYGE